MGYTWRVLWIQREIPRQMCNSYEVKEALPIHMDSSSVINAPTCPAPERWRTPIIAPRANDAILLRTMNFSLFSWNTLYSAPQRRPYVLFAVNSWSRPPGRDARRRMKNETKASVKKDTKTVTPEITAAEVDIHDCVHWKNANIVRGSRPRVI